MVSVYHQPSGDSIELSLINDYEEDILTLGKWIYDLMDGDGTLHGFHVYEDNIPANLDLVQNILSKVTILSKLGENIND